MRTATLILFALVGLGSPGCQGEGQSAPRPAARAGAGGETLRQALHTYADLAHAAYADSAAGARALAAAAATLVTRPSDETFAATKKAWLDAREPYRRTEHLRFYGGPIDEPELLINTWPIDESYVEAAPGEAPTGILDDARRFPELTPAVLRELNAKAGETSISTGYHVIEFLLWGRDTRPDGAGDRPFTDYDPKRSLLATRRAAYLTAAIGLLAGQLDELARAWAPDRPGNYRARFLALPPRDALALAVKGMGTLSGPELAGERLTVAYETKDQENEHSCFSDTTHDDLVGNAEGIESACLGRAVRADGSVLTGVGLCDAVAVAEPQLATRLRAELASSVERLRRIPAPFDRAIQGADDAPGRLSIEASIAALAQQTRTLTQVAARFELRATFAVVPARIAAATRP